MLAYCIACQGFHDPADPHARPRIDRNLSYSQIKTWQECKAQWGYKYRSGYRPKQPKLEFMRGSLLHAGMEHGVRSREYVERTGQVAKANPWQMALIAWNKEWAATGGEDELIIEPGFFEGCKEIVDGALAVFHQDWEVLCDNDGPLIERRMYADLPDYYRGVVFIPDAVCRRRTGPFAGGIFGVDFKSFSKPKLEFAGDVDLQGAIYQRGIRQKGYQAIGSCLFQLATEPRKAIRLTKAGEPYKGDQDRFDNWKPVTGQIITTRSEEFLENVWSQVVIPIAHEMYNAEVHQIHLVPHLNYYGCAYCEFREPCLARLKGHDEDAILASSFVKRQPR